MKAIFVHEHGDPDKLYLQEAPLPIPDVGEVRIQVAATGVNFIETYQRRGLYPVTLPFCPGSEFSGVVDALGEGVSDFQVGDRVGTASGMGGYAEYALAPAALVVPVPVNVNLEQAAAVLLQGMTAHYLATSTFPIKPGDVALVHAAAGGVGQILVQIAKKRGGTVIATVSNTKKAEIARQVGADAVINYTQEDFAEAALRLNGGKKLEVVYDGVGKDTFLKGFDILKTRGTMALFGQSSGAVDPVDPQLLNRKGSLYLTRPLLAHYLLNRSELLLRAGELFKWIMEGELQLTIDQVFPLSQAADAHRYLEGRMTKGKVILKV